MRLTKWDFVAVCSLAAGLLAVAVSTAQIAAQQRGISPRTQSDNEPPVALVIRSGSDAGEAKQPDPPDEADESPSGTVPDTGAYAAMSDGAPE